MLSAKARGLRAENNALRTELDRLRAEGDRLEQQCFRQGQQISRLTEELARVKDVLRKYRSDFCEGFCGENDWSDAGHSHPDNQCDCSGCLAAATLLTLTDPAPVADIQNKEGL